MKAVTFKLPEGVVIPDGLAAGDKFSAMTEYQLGADGSVKVCSVDGEYLDPKYEDENEPNPNAQDDTTQPSFIGGLMGGQGQ